MKAPTLSENHSTKRRAGRIVLEKHVQNYVVQYLKLDGWRSFRTELTVQRKFGRVVGERGQPDYLFIRYQNIPLRDPSDLRIVRANLGAPHAEVLWCEFKAPGEKPRTDQKAWHDAERARGGTVLVFDSQDGFLEWYKASGLQRKAIK